MTRNSFLIIIAIIIATKLIASGPKYPMYGIISNGAKISYSMTSADYKYLAATYKMLYSTFSAEVKDSLVKYNANLDLIKYVNTAEYSSTKITQNKIAKYKWIEENERRSEVAHYCIGVIKSGLNLSDTVVSIYNANKPFNKISSLLASTSNGNFSVDGSQFVCWIRIGDELMRINKITDFPDHRDLNVVRGFGKSISALHANGDSIFHPVYRSTGYPNRSNELCYFADPATPLRRDRTIDEYLDMKAEGQYNGIWMDVFGATIGVGPVTANGGKLTNGEIFDFITRKTYADNSLMGTYNYRNLCQAYDSIVTKTGEKPTLYANNINTGNYAGNQIFFQPYKGQKLIKMFCQESASTVLDIDPPFLEWNSNHTINPQLGYHFAYQDIYSKWLGSFNNTRDAALKGNCIGPIVFQAGVKTQMFETIEDSLRHSIEMYHFAGYLLAIDSNKTCWLGETPLSAKYATVTDQNGIRKPIVLPAWRWPIGEPTQDASVDFIQNTINIAPRVYGRVFTNGIALVCPDTTGTATINLNNYGGPYYVPETGEYVSNIQIHPHQGIVLLKNIKTVELNKIYPPSTVKNKSLYLGFNDLMDIPTLGVGIEIRELLTNKFVPGEWSQAENNLVKFTSQTGFLNDIQYKVTVTKKINSDEGYSPTKDTTLVFTVSNTNGITYAKSDKNLVFYPNPTKSYITINDPSVSELFLTDLLGKRTITLKRKTENVFELNNVISGSYVLVALTNNDIRKHAIIIVLE